MAPFLLYAVSLTLFQLGNALPFEKELSECDNPADVVFLLDCSTSMYPSQFKQQLAFVNNFTESMDVDNGKIRIAVVTFSTTVQTEFNLNTYKTKAEVQKAVSDILYLGGRTHTWLALDHIRQEIFTTDNGGRIGVPKIVIMITDGGSNEKKKTIEAAKILHNDPLRVFTIGIGPSVDTDELKAIASKPSNIFQIEKFDALKALTSEIIKNVCIRVCGVDPSDIIFLLDESTSIYDDDFGLQLTFLTTFIKDSVIGINATQIGVVTFSSNVIYRIKLNQFSKSDDLTNAVLSINRNHGDTNTGDALKLIREEGFSKENGGRDGVPHILIVITDGQAQSPTKTARESKAIHKTDTVIFTIGIGPAVDPAELRMIAGSDDKVFTTASYSTLKTIEKSLFTKVCRVEVIKNE